MAVNELEKKVLFGEVKRNSDKINLVILTAKAQNLVAQFQGYQITYSGFSMDDM